jgi:DNA-binding MarR family transcriptional regulator
MDFDKLVHQPTRLQIFAYLYQHGETSFPTLREELDVTEGNLSSHLQTMEEADAIDVQKQFVDRKPRTTYALTEMGRSKFEDHIGTLEALIEDLDG